jgi:hypothetical protein
MVIKKNITDDLRIKSKIETIISIRQQTVESFVY